jgi:hypothetical protein
MCGGWASVRNVTRSRGGSRCRLSRRKNRNLPRAAWERSGEHAGRNRPCCRHGCLRRTPSSPAAGSNSPRQTLHSCNRSQSGRRGWASATDTSRKRTRPWPGSPCLAWHTPVPRLLPAGKGWSAQAKRVVGQRDDVGQRTALLRTGSCAGRNGAQARPSRVWQSETACLRASLASRTLGRGTRAGPHLGQACPSAQELACPTRPHARSRRKRAGRALFLFPLDGKSFSQTVLFGAIVQR